MPGIPRVFFIHVMKVGGTSFKMMLLEHYGYDEVYPPRGVIDVKAYTEPSNLVALPPQRRQAIGLFSGHVPFFTVELVGEKVLTLAFFREPVSRVISHLKHDRARAPDARRREGSLMDIYEAPPHLWDTKNLQVKTFAMRPGECETAFWDYAIDDRAMARALENVKSLDFIGLKEDYQNSLTIAEHLLGVPLNRKLHALRSANEEVPENLVSTIRRDNGADIEFYDEVCEIYEERKRRHPAFRALQQPR